MMSQMFQSLIAAILMGLVSLPGNHSSSAITLEDMVVSPPSEIVEIRRRLSASGVVIMDLDSGQQVFARQAEFRRPMASLTKLMTATIIVENHDLEEVVLVPWDIAETVGNKAYLPPGAQFTVADLLSALLISSANDAAIALAEFHSGSESAFVAEMNERARVLGLQLTAFSNPSGLDGVEHWSTPQDLAWLTAFALRYPAIEERMGKRGERIVSGQGEMISLTHTHALMHADTPVVGGKTGTTLDAGQCLISVVEEGGRTYVVVLLQSLQRYQDMRVILSALESRVSPDATLQAKLLKLQGLQ